MTTLVHTPLTQPPLDPDLAGALDGLAAAAEQAADDACSRSVLAAVVERLEHATGAELGSAAGDPLVVLQRRFGRAHVRLAGRRAADLDADLLPGLLRALLPEAVSEPRPQVRQASATVLAGC